MGATALHVFTSPIADGTNTQLVRPSNWNSEHLLTINAVGSEISNAFGNGGGVSFGYDGTNITASAPSGGGGAAISAGANSQSTGTVIFSNLNGVSFGLNAGTMTASHNGLTTAMASNRGSDFVQATAAFAGTNASGTIASNGISVSIGNYITTARASNDAIGLNSAFTAGPLAMTINSSGLSLNAASAAGTSSGFGGNLISGSMTHNTAGLNLSLNHPAWLTTAMQSNAATISNVRVSAGTTSNLLSAITFSNLNGVSFGLDAGTMTASHNGLTTAAQSNHSHGNPTLNLTNLSGTTASASNGFTLSLSAGNYLTTARASNDAIGTNTAQSNVTWTANSAGLSFDARGYAGTGFTGTNATATFNSLGLQLSVAGGGVINQTGPNISAGSDSLFTSGTVTFGNAFSGSFVTSNGSVVYSNAFLTTAAQSNHSHGNPTLALTNLNGTTASASNGLTISLSAAAAGGGATLSFFENVPVIHGTQTFNAVSSTMYIYPFTLSQNISVGFIRLPMSGSVAPTTGGVPGANSSISGQMGYTHGFVIYTQGVGASANSLQYFTSTSGTGSFGTTISAGANSSQQTVTVNGSFGQSGAQTNLGTGVSYGVSSGSYVVNSSAVSNFTGPRFADIEFAQSLSAGNYWMGIGRSWSSANNSSIFNGVNLLSSNIFISQTNITWGIMGSATNTSNIMRQPGAGFFTTNASIISTNSINAVGQISVTTSNLVPYFQFLRKA